MVHRSTAVLTLVLSVLTLVLSLACAPALHAQGMTSFGVAAGATIPTGDFGNQTQTGYHGMVTLDVHPPLAPVGLRFDGMFNELSYNSSLTSSGKSQIWAATANVVLNPSGFVGPYAIGGLGVYHQVYPAMGLAQSYSTDHAGLNAGIGFRIGLSGFYAFAEARYHKVLDQPTQFVPVSFGLVF